MNGRTPGEPRRWTEGGGDSETARRAGELLAISPPPPLGAVRRALIARRLDAGPPPHPTALVKLVGPAITVAIASAIAVGAPRLLHRRAPVPAPAPATHASPAARGKQTESTTDPGQSPTAPSPQAAASRSPIPPAGVSPLHRRVAVASPIGAPAAAARVPATAPPAPEPAPPPPRVAAKPAPPADASEPRLLADALARLRAGGDAAGALALLAEHRARFPHGALASEASVAEVEALLALGRRTDALRVLDGLRVSALPAGAGLAVLRGELRAEAGRCAEATRDFDGCAAGGRGCPPEVEERALFGRASCRGRGGDSDGARADLERYLRRFPAGPRADSVHRALAPL